MPTRGVRTHLLAPDGFTWCNKEPEATLAVSGDPERTTCLHCLTAAKRGARGRADRQRVTLSTTAQWNRDLHDDHTRWSVHRGRYFKVWRVQPWSNATDRSWHVEEVTLSGEPAGHASLDPAKPGERVVIWVGGFYARAADLDEARRLIADA